MHSGHVRRVAGVLRLLRSEMQRSSLASVLLDRRATCLVRCLVRCGDLKRARHQYLRLTVMLEDTPRCGKVFTKYTGSSKDWQAC